MKYLLLLPLLLAKSCAFSQCIVIVESTDDYEVSIEIDITGISAPGSCPWGYNFNIEFDYIVNIYGPDAPAGLWTLQGNIACDDYPSNFYDLPVSGGSGSGITVSNPYNSNTDCTTATPESLGCDAVNVTIQGPGIPTQTVKCSFGDILPVDLLLFQAMNEKNKVKLEWITASEIDNDYFSIEHSTNGSVWQSIDTVQGAGNSTELLHYRYRHLNPALGMNYYRLKQVDFNGDFDYSKIVVVNTNNRTDSYLKLYPNPANNQVIITGSSTDLARLEIYDNSGRNIPFSSTQLNSNSVKIDLTDFASGIYHVKSGSCVKKMSVTH